MKVALLRQSLNPVADRALDRMMEDYKSAYDTILDEHGQDMKTVHEMVEEMIEELNVKYKDDIEIMIELPKSAKQWAKLIDTHGVISIGTHAETGKVALIIMDKADSGIAF